MTFAFQETFHPSWQVLFLKSYTAMAKLNLLAVCLLVSVGMAVAGDMMRKSIVYDKKTPNVFYCPQQKPTGFDKMIVRAKPLSKLCELEGKPLPPDYKSDCYNDVDESEYACKEKHRIMMRLHPPGSENLEEDIRKAIQRIMKKKKF